MSQYAFENLIGQTSHRGMEIQNKVSESFRGWTPPTPTRYSLKTKPKIRVTHHVKSKRVLRDIEWLKPTCKVRDKETLKPKDSDRVIENVKSTSPIRDNTYEIIHAKFESHKVCKQIVNTSQYECEIQSSTSSQTEMKSKDIIRVLN